MAPCKLKSFTMRFGTRNISWPGRFFKTTTIRFPVEFRLELEEGCTRADCLIGQYRKGRVEMSGRVSEEFLDWSGDSDVGKPHWWDGSNWYGGNGDWSWFGEKATFEDEPGFNNVDQAAFPLYWGGPVRAGYFEFRTYVKDKASGTTLKELQWGILISVQSPEKGGHHTTSCKAQLADLHGP